MQKYVALVSLVLSLIISLLFFSQVFVVMPKIDSLEATFKGTNEGPMNRTGSKAILMYGVVSALLSGYALLKKSYTPKFSNFIVALALINLIVLVIGVIYSSVTTFAPINDLYSGL